MTPVQLLIQALRSGEYTQGRGTLANREYDQTNWQYCCLGVACELYQVHVGGLRVEIVGNERRYNGESSHLPEKVRKWLGFEDFGGNFVERLPSPDGRDRRADSCQMACPGSPAAVPRKNKTYENLVDANDDGYFTFAEIADLLEAGKVKAAAA